MIATLPYCCCGCSLKKATLAIGTFYVLFYLSVCCAIVYLVITNGVVSSHGYEVTTIECILVAVFLTCTLHVIVNIVLIVGVVRNQARCCYAWVVVYMIALPLKIVYCIVDLVGKSEQEVTFGLLFGQVVYEIVEILVHVYFMWVVYSHYRALRDSQRLDFDRKKNVSVDAESTRC